MLRGHPAEPAATLTDLLFRDAGHNKSYVVKRPRKGVREASLFYRELSRTEELSLVRVQLHGKVAEALIEKNGQLNRGHQHRRNGNGLERPCHDEENAGDGKVVRHHKVHGGGVDEVAVHSALTGDHGVLIVFFQNGVDLAIRN